MYDNLSDVLSQLQLEDFEKYVNGVDLDNLTSSVVETAREKYVALPEDFRKKVSDDVLAKFMVIIKPESSDYKFDKEIKEYQMTKIVRPADSEVANTVGGIQSAVDGLWSVVTDTVLPLVAPEVDLSNGLDPILEENVYTNEMVSKIFDLYATLSHDETDIGVAGMTLGGVIKLIISPSKIATVLEEEKYSAAAEKIKACKDLDALAEAAFESGDFGFQDGDRQGFVDALLAVLRPITTLLAPGTSILIVDVGVNMFDYVDGNGQYVEGVYSRLIPLLEQIGATSLPTTEEYKANYYKVAETSKNIAADEFLRPVIDALLNDVLDVVSPDPLNGLIKVLPRIAYVIGTDELNDTIAGVFTQMGVLKDLGSSLDLSADAINKMLTASPIDLGELCALQWQDISFSEKTVTIKHTMQRLQYDDPNALYKTRMAEYYSAELSQKIHRGMAINAEKCLSNGSNPGLGFKVDSERRFYVDNDEAAIVREIYERYAAGETKAEIIRDLQRRKVKTSLGKEFSSNSLSRLLSNKRYIGVYLYKGQETPGGMPRILDDDLFYRVQALMNKNKAAPARIHGEGEYLLTTKLFCGYCKEMMVGYGGTGKSGRQYHYYNCKNARKKKCKKKIISKQYIEDRVVAECLKLLTDENIAFIAKMVAEECNKSPDNISVKGLKKAIQEADTAIENLWRGIEQGQSVEMLTERINKRKAEKAELEEQLAIEQNKKICLTEPQIHAFLDYVCEMPADDANKRRAIINIFVHSIYLYDDYFTLIINASRKPLSIENIPLDDIEAAFSGDTYTSAKCSSMKLSAPPKKENGDAN